MEITIGRVIRLILEFLAIFLLLGLFYVLVWGIKPI
jgi:hypothetical protein